MKIKNSLFIILFTGVITGCAGTTRIVTDTIGAGIGAVAGNKLSKGDPLITAVGGGAGLLLSETLNYAHDKQTRKAYVEGLDKGRSDAVKQQYWMMVNQQKSAEAREFDESMNLFELPLPEQETDGMLLQPNTNLLNIEK